MSKILVCRATPSKVVLYTERGKRVIESVVLSHKPNNTIHFGKKLLNTSCYLDKSGKYFPLLSEKRKLRLWRLDIARIKESALNNLETRLALNKIK